MSTMWLSRSSFNRRFSTLGLTPPQASRSARNGRRRSRSSQMIDRTCARCGCAYEWGVHVAFFADRVKLTPEQVRPTVTGDAVWSDDERLLIRVVDELHDTSRISDDLWGALTGAFTTEQVFEVIAL